MKSKKQISYVIISDAPANISQKCLPNHTYEIIGGICDWYSVWASNTLVFLPKSQENISYTTFTVELPTPVSYYERS